MYRSLTSQSPSGLVVKSEAGVGHPIYDFPLVFNSNIWPSSALSQDASLHNLSDPDFDLSMSNLVVQSPHI